MAFEPSIDERDALYERLGAHDLVQKVTGLKKVVVEKLLAGDNFRQIARDLKIKDSQIYAMKNELQKDFAFLLDEAKRQQFVEKNSTELNLLLSGIQVASTKLRLSQFQEIFINDYDLEAQQKHWRNVPLQDVYENIWETHQKSSTQAPREHLKTTSVIAYLVKKVFERKFPLEINYFHLSKEIAIEKVRKIQMIVERNPILAANFRFSEAKNWKDGEIRLVDGTTIQAMGWLQGAVGKHPHIIVMDDVIDQSVIYSDHKNEKAIGKFYSEVYPMISRLSPEKRIIVVGTAQREDDLYTQLPDDFHKVVMQAVDENKKTVLEPALFSFEDLMKIKSDISSRYGEKYWLKEYQNVPFSALGMTIKAEWIKTYSAPPPLKKLEIYQGWDLSPVKKVDQGDWKAGATIGRLREDNLLFIYLLEMFRARIQFPERLKAIVALANKWKPRKIGVEDNVFQYDTVATLKKQTNLPIEGVTSLTNKVESFQVELAPHFENGKVIIGADMENVRQELLSLPVGKFDDQADALKIAIKVSSHQTFEPRIRVI